MADARTRTRDTANLRRRAHLATATAVTLVVALLGLPASPASAATVPGKPATTALPGNGSFTVSWTAPSSSTAVTGYQVGTRRYSAKTRTWSAWAVVTVAASARSKTVSGTNGTTVQGRVRAKNAAGWGSWSSAATVIVGTPRPPTTINAASNNGSALVQWTASTANGSAVKAYQLQSRSKAGGSSTWSTWITKSYAASARSATITKANGSTVQHRLRATNARGAGPWSTTRSVTIGLPARVTGVVATASPGSLAITWNTGNGNGSAVSSYVVSRRQRASSSAPWGAWTTTTVTAPTVTSTVDSLATGSQHEVTVAAINAIGTGPASITASATIPAPAVWTTQLGATTIGLGTSNACMLTAASAVRCWGGGARGDGTDVGVYSGQVPVSGLSDVVAVAVGNGFDCALTSGGTVWCWGANGAGQVGDATVTADPVTTPVQVQGLPAAATQVTAGQGTACALLVTNDLWCWGLNIGVMGTADNLNGSFYSPVKVPGLGKVVAVDVGGNTVCAIQEEGSAPDVARTAYCWGNNREGAVDGTQDVGYAIVAPRRVGTFSSVTAIATSSEHSCLVDSGQVWCWGKGPRLGIADWFSLGIYLGPQKPDGLPIDSWTGLSVGDAGTCVVDSSGTPYCWGFAVPGGSSTVPKAYTGFGQKVLETATGVLETACARLEDGSVWCWGSTLLITAEAGTSTTPIKVTG